MSKYDLRRPCPHCPFRTDIPGYLARGRGAEIAQSLAEGAEFPCHKTTVTDPDDDCALVATRDSQFCAGALIVLERQDTPNQMMRVAERLGVYDPARLDMDAPVAGSLIEFARHHDGYDEEDAEPECCSVADMGCEAPAGMLMGGMVVPAERTGDTHPCPECYEPVCDSCADEEGRCTSCAEYAMERAS